MCLTCHRAPKKERIHKRVNLKFEEKGEQLTSLKLAIHTSATSKRGSKNQEPASQSPIPCPKFPKRRTQFPQSRRSGNFPNQFNLGSNPMKGSTKFMRNLRNERQLCPIYRPQGPQSAFHPQERIGSHSPASRIRLLIKLPTHTAPTFSTNARSVGSNLKYLTKEHSTSRRLGLPSWSNTGTARDASVPVGSKSESGDGIVPESNSAIWSYETNVISLSTPSKDRNRKQNLHYKKRLTND